MMKLAGLKVVGLTGGIGSGKSTVAEMLRGHGLPIIDADKIARKLLTPGQVAHDEVIKLFPEAAKVVNVDGPYATIDRPRLAEIVFSDPEKRRRLEEVMHPLILGVVAEMADEIRARGHKIVVYDAPLLMEAGHDKDLDEVVLVFVPEHVQVARAVARGGLTEAQVRARIAAQMSWDEKFKRATFVIDNAGSLEETRKRVHWFVASLGLTEAPRAPQPS